jgi:ribose transport system substrate-binding protein
VSVLRHQLGRRRRLAVGCALAVGVLALASAAMATSTSSTAKYKVVLSLSYSGNDWQNEAANLVKAEAATAPYNKLVDFKMDIAGADVTKQIQTLNNEIASHVNAIIVYPISPSALNGTIQRACAAGIVVYAYDSLVTAPCAYNVHIDQYQYGTLQAQWLAKYLHGKGKLAVISGVAGTTVDTDRLKGLHDVLKKYPGLTVAGQANGMWAQAQGKTAFASIYTAHPDVNGIWAEAACYSITQYQLQHHTKPLPCAGETENGARRYMLPKSKGGVGLQGFSIGSPTYSGELAFINAVKILQGQKVAHDTILPLPIVTNANLKIGTNPANSNVYPTSITFGGKNVTVNPGFFNDIWTPLVEQGLGGALTGKSNKVYSAKPCAQVPGCKQQSKLVFDKNHSGGN